MITDIAGYFVGRVVGGAKFWPAFSPKKTWSGIVGGWIGAVLFTYVMVQGGYLALQVEAALFIALTEKQIRTHHKPDEGMVKSRGEGGKAAPVGDIEFLPVHEIAVFWKSKHIRLVVPA